MAQSRSLDDFLKNKRIDRDTWDRSKSDWSLLQEIGNDHESNREQLLQSAEYFGRLIQNFDCMHSVRWRVKDTDHLLEKIVRKRAEESAKYLEINQGNYHEAVTDLVGIRALHLFKDDCFTIDATLRAKWEPIETPAVYIRTGDHEDLSEKFRDQGFEMKEHPAGYRSIHYVFSTQPARRKVIVEVQVRTIFEEGWSEIDHKVRYPNLSSNDLLGYFLTIFNRMAGSADEMGGFVRVLSSGLRELEEQVSEANRDKEKTLFAVDEALRKLENANPQNQELTQSIATLKAEIEKLREPLTDFPSAASGLLEALKKAAANQEGRTFKASDTISELEKIEFARRLTEQTKRAFLDLASGGVQPKSLLDLLNESNKSKTTKK